MDRRNFLLSGGVALTGVSPILAARAGHLPESALKHVGSDYVRITDFGAVGDGVTDCLPALEQAHASGRAIFFPAGTYYFGDHFRPPNGSSVIWIGESEYTVTIKTAKNKVAVLFDTSFHENRSAAGIYVENITFDGGYSWANKQIVGMRTAISAKGRPGDELADCIIRNCRFLNMHAGCLWLTDFNGRVEVTGCHILCTKSVNILYSDDVLFADNVCEYVQDNAVAISRGMKKVVVSGNRISECSINGIFLGAVTLKLPGAVILSGEQGEGGYSVLKAENHRYGWHDIGKTFVLRAGQERAFVVVSDLVSEKQARVRNLSEIPDALHGRTTDDWSQGPESGCTGFVISGNVIEGAGGNAILLGHAPRNGSVFGNIIMRPGLYAIRDAATKGSILQSQNTLRVEDASPFAIGDWLVIKPNYSSQEEVISQIQDISGNTVVLANRSDYTCLDEPVYKAVRKTGKAGIVAFGWQEGGSLSRHAKYLSITNNTIINPVNIGIKIGSRLNGPVKSSLFSFNRIVYEATSHAENRRYGILIEELDDEASNLQCQDIDIAWNFINMNESGVNIGYRMLYSRKPTNVRIEGNVMK